MAHSIEAMGLGRSVLIDRDDNVVAGNGTLEAASAAGVTKVRVIETDGTELIAVKRTNLEGLQSKAMAIADNRTAELATWDIEQLDRTLAELDEAEFAVDDLGFDETDLGDLFSDLDTSLMIGKKTGQPTADGEATEPAIPEQAQAEWQVQPGDLWLIHGEQSTHRLLCGDVTSEVDVARLFGDSRASLVVADPPYGMGKEADGVVNDNLYREKLDAFQMAWFRTIRPHVLDAGSSFYIWGNSEDLYRLWFCGGLRDAERLTLRNEIVWDKEFIAGMGSDLMTQYPIATERCLFIQVGDQFIGNVNADQYWEGWDEVRLPLVGMAKAAGLTSATCREVCGVGMFQHWFSRSQWQMISEKYYSMLQQAYPDAFSRPYHELRDKYDQLRGGFRNHLNGILGGMRAYFDNAHDNMTDVWRFGRVHGDERMGHATPKPVSMMRRHVVSSAPPNAIVCEPFGGTGPVMAACEATGRHCRTSELQPEYCAVILQRMKDLGCRCERMTEKKTARSKPRRARKR